MGGSTSSGTVETITSPGSRFGEKPRSKYGQGKKKNVMSEEKSEKAMASPMKAQLAMMAMKARNNRLMAEV